MIIFLICVCIGLALLALYLWRRAPVKEWHENRRKLGDRREINSFRILHPSMRSGKDRRKP